MRPLAVLLVLLACLATGGCCSIARLACGIEPPGSPAKGNRDTPEAAVDFLVDAFRERRKTDLYESFSSEFRRENGDFTLTEFGVAYDKAESEFLADAESLASAERRWLPPRGGDVVVELSNPSTGAFFPIAFRNRPRVRVVFDDPFVPPISAPAARGLVVRMADGRVTLDLTRIEGVEAQTLGGLTEANVLRLEFSDDWQVLAIDTQRARNIRFLDKIKEYAGR